WIKQEYETAGSAPNGDAPEDEPMLIVPDAPEPVPGPSPEIASVRPQEPPGAPAEPERKPVAPPRKRRGLLSRQPQDGKPPAKRIPRVSVANLISSGWGLAAMALVRNPNAVPIGRVLQMQAPVAGVIVDDMVKGTPVDRLLQPLARAGERGEKAVALI